MEKRGDNPPEKKSTTMISPSTMEEHGIYQPNWWLKKHKTMVSPLKPLRVSMADPNIPTWWRKPRNSASLFLMG